MSEAEAVRAKLQRIARLVNEELGGGIGFALLTSCEDSDGGGRVEYVSNCARPQMIKMMREYIDHAEGVAGKTN